jgi:Flp pilus assembly protein TadB
MKLEHEKEMASSDTNGSPVAFILFVIMVFVIVLLWTFFPSLFLMVVVFLGSLVVVYNTRAVQENIGKEI